MRQARFTVAAGEVLLEAARHFNGTNAHAPGMVEGLEMVRAGLARIAKRAIELGDEALLDEMQSLGCVKAAE